MKKRYRRSACIALISMILTGCSAQTLEKETLPELVIGGTPYSPYFYKDMDGEYAGIDVDVAEAACSRIGYTPVFKELAVTDLYTAIENGEVDCLWSCMTMDGREDEFLWSDPYLYSQRVVMVRADSEINSLADLEGKRAAVQAGSTSERIIMEQSNDIFPELSQLTSFRTLGEVFMALRKGYVDAAVGHECALRVYEVDYPDEYRFLNMSLRSEKLGVAFKKDYEETTVDQISKVLQEMREDGTMEEIVEKYGLNIQKNVYGGSMDGETETEE